MNDEPTQPTAVPLDAAPEGEPASDLPASEQSGAGPPHDERPEAVAPSVSSALVPDPSDPGSDPSTTEDPPGEVTTDTMGAPSGSHVAPPRPRRHYEGIRGTGISARSSEQFPRPSCLRVITVANQKGGVGKTTTVVNLGVALAQHGASVLVIDLDPQGNASTALAMDRRAGVPNTYDVLIGEATLEAVARPVEDVPGLWCAPATIDLAGAEIELVSLVARESRLRRALDGWTRTRRSAEASSIAAERVPEPGTADEGSTRAEPGRFDYVLVDCPPSLGLLTVNALVAADEVLVPIQCEYYALEGVGQLVRTIDLIRAHLNESLRISTVLLTMYDGRTRLSEQVAAEVRRHFDATVLRTVIPRSVRVSEAPGFAQSVMTYDPDSRGAVSYLVAARELATAGTEVVR